MARPQDRGRRAWSTARDRSIHRGTRHGTTPRGPCRHTRAGPRPLPGGSPHRPRPGAAGRGGHQGRGAGRRRESPAGTVRARPERLLGAVQQRQEEPGAQPAERAGARRGAAPGRGVRRADPELPARHDRGHGARVRTAEGAEPRPHHGERVGLRPVRPVPRPHRLRPHRAGHQRHDVPHRLSRQPAHPHLQSRHRPHHRPARRHRRAGGAAGAPRLRRGPVRGRVPGGHRLQHDGESSARRFWATARYRNAPATAAA